MMKPELMKSKENKTIIGFAGRLRSGKDVLSNAMHENFNAQTITVADALKKLICDMRPDIFTGIEHLNRLKVKNIGLVIPITDENVSFLSDKTNVPYAFVKELCDEKITWTSVRDMLQFIGTDIIRKYNPSWHVEKLKEAITDSDSEYICIDDIRFPNEREAVEELGGEVFFIIRPQCETMSNHESETSLRWLDFDYSHIILNEYTEDVLRNSFIGLFETDFRCPGECPILLSGNEYYTNANVNFGINPDEEELLLVNLILEQNKDSDLFRKYGIVSIYTTDMDEQMFIAHKIFNSWKGIEYCRSKFMVYNPLIYENLKFYL